MAFVDLWHFSKRLYSQPGVEDLCLKLQDSHNANVLILLWCAWLEMQAHSLSDDQLQSVSQRVAFQSASTVVPLRTLRRSLKTSPVLPDDVARQARKKILEAELVMERHLLEQLQSMSTDPAALCGDGSSTPPLALYWKKLQNSPAEAGLLALKSAAERVWSSVGDQERIGGDGSVGR